MKLKLLPKFIISLGVVGLVLTIVISIFSYGTSKSYLENMYAERVMTNSNAIAAMVSVEDVQTIIGENGDQTEAYERMVALFNKLKQDGDVTFLSLVIPDEDSVTFYIDAMVEEMGDDPANQLPYGADILYVDAANPDDPADMEKYIRIWQEYAQHRGIDAPLVTDNDYGYNYTGVSVILDAQGQAVAEIQYILDMSEVRAYLNSFLVNMLLISFAIIAITIVTYIFFVRKVVTSPIGKLADFTQGITDSGVFENQRICIKTPAVEISCNCNLCHLRLRPCHSGEVCNDVVHSCVAAPAIPSILCKNILSSVITAVHLVVSMEAIVAEICSPCKISPYESLKHTLCVCLCHLTCMSKLSRAFLYIIVHRDIFRI